MTADIQERIWSDLTRVSRFGVLEWKFDGSRLFKSLEPDSRMYPARYIAMSGDMRSWNSSDNTFKVPSDLKEIGHRRFETTSGVRTNVIGLLQLIDAFKFGSNDPRNILLVGAITEKSLMCTLEMVSYKNWQAKTTLVDISSVPLEHIRLQREYGLYAGSPEFEVVQDNILSFSKTKFDVVIGDILNTWCVPHYENSRHDPYCGFEEMLLHIRGLLTKRGIFYSRCVIYPNSDRGSNTDLNVRSVSNRTAERIAARLGSLSDQVSFETLVEAASTMFLDTHPTSYCGLSQFRQFAKCPTLEGEHAKKQMVRLHRKVFNDVDLITVHDLKNGATYLNFACKN